ncbi:helix-turn-helix domain-containing protein [Sphingopyxis indica]|uniref:Transcriptional regulator, AraC family n=1 Tax=Sphingopyxis indica TaxID=436663 RepID=A0A239J195_9SPHN|nr:AraC family transcriptional regulator [Sphingopyxis indica]SNS99043.1 transcriptional regulator, AraC family [Sphingopyxis indica]
MSLPGIGRHAAGEALPRHRHAEPYVAVVLSGGYVEAGDQGRIDADAGTVVVHDRWTAHRDLFGRRGAEVLNLPFVVGMRPGAGRLADPDFAVRLCERDPVAAARHVRDHIVPIVSPVDDWPDLLAAALRDDPDLRLTDWARGAALDPASVSRGFARAYGVTPKRFRLEARVRRALAALDGWQGSLADLAAAEGFADQAHMTRAVAIMTGMPPAAIRAKSVQAGNSANR